MHPGKGQPRQPDEPLLASISNSGPQQPILKQGKALRRELVAEVETVFGQIKHHQRFRRFVLCRLEKTIIELGLLCLAHNIKKLAIQ